MVYMAVEDIESRVNGCCDEFHPVDLKVLDLYKNTVLYFNRSVNFCFHTVEVSSSPEGQVIGSVRQELTWWDQSYKIRNRNGETVLRIVGPNWLSVCGSNVDFKVIFERVELDWIGWNWHLLIEFFSFILADCRQKRHANRPNLE